MVTQAEAHDALELLKNERLPVSSLIDMNYTLSGGRAVFYAGNQASGSEMWRFVQQFVGSDLRWIQSTQGGAWIADTLNDFVAKNFDALSATDQNNYNTFRDSVCTTIPTIQTIQQTIPTNNSTIGVRVDLTDAAPRPPWAGVPSAGVRRDGRGLSRSAA